MSPKPYDDGLFIEPAGDYDVVYGDYNATMSDGTLSGKRPYIRLTSALRNMTRPVGGEVRMRCEAAGSPMPIQFTWLKNLAPVEKDRRIRIRHREMSSKLVIVELDVLDSGYYQCTANNAAGSVNSTAVLRVSPSIPSSASSSSSAHNKKKPLGIAGADGRSGNSNRLLHHHQHSKHLQQQQEEDDYDNAYDNYMDEEMKSAGTDNMDDVWRVSGSAAGPGYVPLRRQGAEADGRWLDGQMVRKGDCIAYRGEACAQFLAGKHVKVLVDREQIYDAEKDLLAALMTVRVMPGVSEQCRQYSHQVACYHMFKVCDPTVSTIAALASPSGTDIIAVCREDCFSLKTSDCPNEFAMAAQHDLVGDTPKALLPNCDALLPGAQRCLSVLDKHRTHQPNSPASPPSSSSAGDGTSSSSSSAGASHWCFVGHGTKYLGNAAVTRSNRPCIFWPSSTNTEFNTDSHAQLRTAKNHCRNPSRRSQFSEPWCYTVSPGSQQLVAEPCNVPRCPPNLYPELDDALDGTTGGGSPNSILESLTSFWQSMSAQTQVLAFTSGLGAMALLLFLLVFCCIFCCRNSRQRRKASRNGGALNGGGGGMCRGTMQQESASSMLSGSVVAGGGVVAQQQKMAMAAQQQQQNHQSHPHMLVQSCNGGSTITGSDLNSAFYRKVRDERMRAIGADELLNPLLPPYGNGTAMLEQQQQMAMAYPQHPQQQMFEMQNQQQQQQQAQQPPPPQFRHYWEAVGTLNSASAVGSAYPGYYGAAQSMQSLPMQPPPLPPHPSTQQQQQQQYNSPHTSTEPPPAEPYQIAHIQEQQLKFFDRVLGEDTSTQLTLGEWVGGMISGAKLQVAMKTLKPNMPHIVAEQFREEIQAIGFFEHPNVLRLFGVSFLNGRDICAVFDYMIHGDLVEFLKVREPRGGGDDEQERQRNSEDFLRIGTQITAGCAYLAANGFVHRDLAARNCLVGDQQVIKIANFARMKPQYERDYYRMNTNCRGVPLRWMSKEALNEGKYSQASDVFAFGVCLWEIYTYARQPYEGCTDEQVIQLIQEDNYLEIPEFCPPAVYAQMVECFNANTGRRPSFAELNSKFQKWCQSGQLSALLMQQHRASSVHSGGSSTGVNGMLTNGGGGGGRMGGGGIRHHQQQQHHYHHQPQGGGNVPSPAPPNACGNTTILAGNLGNNQANNGNNKNGAGGGQLAKLALLGNGGATLIHSTPIANPSEENNKKGGGPRPVPLARRRYNNKAATKAYTDEDELEDDEDDDDDREEEDYTSEESRD